MRVMTFNIQHGLDYQKQCIDLSSFVQAIKEQDADICGLNEVRSEGPDAGYTDQAKFLGEGLGYLHYFGEAIRVGGVNPYGNGFVSRYTFKAVETVPIPDPADKTEAAYYESRCIIRAVLEVEGKDVCLLICHMGLAREERRNAVAALCRLLDNNALPTILMGDFNAVPQDPVLEPLFERMEDSDNMADRPEMPTFPSYAPKEKIDYLLYRGLICRRSFTVSKVISDHLAIVADFDVMA